MPQTTVDKGKGRATPPDDGLLESTERTPLLSGSSSNNLSSPSARHRPRTRLWPRLLLISSLSLLLSLSALLIALTYSYRSQAARIRPEDVLHRGLLVQGPDSVDVLNFTADGEIWVSVGGRVGVDVGRVLELHAGDEDSLWDYVRKGFGRWGVRRLGAVTVTVPAVHLVPSSLHQHPTPNTNTDQPYLATLTIPTPIQLPLSLPPPNAPAPLSNVSLTLKLRPTRDVRLLADFATHSWKAGSVSVRAVVPQVVIRGGGRGEGRSWRSRVIDLKRSDLATSIQKKIPLLPGLPTPGTDEPFPPLSSFITLLSYNITSPSPNSTLIMHAEAAIPNPVPPSLNVHMTVPGITTLVSLPSPDNDTSLSPVPIALATTTPFTLPPSPDSNITLSITAHPVPLPPNTTTSTLSTFLSRYLSALPNPLLLSSPLFPGLSLPASFPAPHPKPKVLRDVTIKDMKVTPVSPGGEGTILASGTVLARAVLPRGVFVDVNVSRVWPDVLVFDGPVPDQLSVPMLYPPEPYPPPDPYPGGAFARIRPDDWVPSRSERVEAKEGEEGDGAVYLVRVQIVDVPLQVLPGREGEFSRFMSKVIFDPTPTLAGLQGTAAIAVRVPGLPVRNGSEELNLDGLPFRGSVRVGKGRVGL